MRCSTRINSLLVRDVTREPHHTRRHACTHSQACWHTHIHTETGTKTRKRCNLYTYSIIIKNTMDFVPRGASHRARACVRARSRVCFRRLFEVNNIIESNHGPQSHACVHDDIDTCVCGINVHTRRGHATKYTLTFKVRSVLVKTVRCVRRTHTHAHTIHMSHVAYIFPLAWRTPQFHKLHIHVHIGISLTLLRAIHTLHNDANMQGWHVRTENT